MIRGAERLRQGWASEGSQVRIYPWLFDKVALRADAEMAHVASLRSLGVLTSRQRISGIAANALTPHDPLLATTVMGLDFLTPLGLAAGFDKNARAIDGLAVLGFGSVEIGTVTGGAQPGNPKPRLFRLPADQAIVNRMGFNNDGAIAVGGRLARRGSARSQAASRQLARPVLGVNIGKTKSVPVERSVADYVFSTGRLAPFADYLVVNVSSPNTPGLRDLQAVESLRPLLEAVRVSLTDTVPDRRVPLLVKIAPDLVDDDVLAVADLALELGLDGIIATNTTISRHGLRSAASDVEDAGAGGLSGPVLASRSLEVLRLLRRRAGDRLTLVSVGGISCAADVWTRMTHGANLVQAYSGLIYGGPRWPAILNAELAHRARTEGVRHIGEIVGTAERS